MIDLFCMLLGLIGVLIALDNVFGWALELVVLVDQVSLATI